MFCPLKVELEDEFSKVVHLCNETSCHEGMTGSCGTPVTANVVKFQEFLNSALDNPMSPTPVHFEHKAKDDQLESKHVEGQEMSSHLQRTALISKAIRRPFFKVIMNATCCCHFHIIHWLPLNVLAIGLYVLRLEKCGR
jgi:hypothetical protein